MSYILTDPKKREHIAADVAAIDRWLELKRAEFGPAFKFKIRVNRDESRRDESDDSTISAEIRGAA